MPVRSIPECLQGCLEIDFAKQNDAKLIIRGLRAVTDFESEMQIAQTNHSIEPEIDTMFFTTSLEYAFLSSTIAKEVSLDDSLLTHHDRYIVIDNKMEIILSSGFMYLELTGKELTYVVRPVQENRLLVNG